MIFVNPICVHNSYGESCSDVALMKGITWCIGLSLVLWGQAARADDHQWVQVAKGYDRSVTEIDVASIERSPLSATFIARSILPFEDMNGIQVYAFQYEVKCSLRTYEVLEAAGYDQDGRMVFYNAERQFSQMVMNNSVMATLRQIACARRR